jgi:signal transduction histidine kinase/ligand-binding sensor domain-containing protein
MAALAVLSVAANLQAALDPRQPISQYIHQSWQTAQGLPQNSVLSLAQTPDGYIWIGTEEGLVRFDGVRFSVFDRSTTGLKNNIVLSLLVDHRHELWLGTYGGGVAHFHAGRFESYTTENGLPNNQVRALYEDAEGAIWIATDGAGLARLQNGTLRVFTRADGLIDDEVFSITGDRNGVLWIGTHNGISRFQRGRFTMFQTSLGGSFVRALYTDVDGTVWAGTNDGLLQISSSGLRCFKTQDGLSSNAIFSIKRDSAGALWIGTTNGLDRLAGGKISQFTEKDGLNGKDVWTILDDKEGTLWVGTAGGGLNAFKAGAFTGMAKTDGLASNVILPIFQDSSGGIWLGSDQGLMSLRNGKVTTYTTKQGLPDNFVFSMAQDRKGTLWIGTRRGLARLNDGQISPVNEVPETAVLCTYVDVSGELWVGTRNGLSHFTKGIVKTYQTKDGLSNDNVVAIFQDSHGVMWVGTGGGGLNRFEGGHFASFTTRNGLGSNVVWSINGEPDGTLWLGTSGGGLNRFRDDKFTVYDRAAGFYDDTVHAILDDHLGNLWLSSNKGVFRVQKAQLNDFAEGRLKKIRPISFGTADGMISAECNGGFQPASLQARDGRLWFPTVKGFAVVNPKEVRERAIPEPVLERAVVNREEVSLESSVKAPPGNGQLEFQFSAPSSIEPQNIEFRYMLEGFDKDWNEAGGRRVAYYTNISPGEYRFHVQAGRPGVWGKSEAGLPLTLEPHYYQTKTFSLLMMVSALALGWAGYRIRVRHLTLREHKLRVLVDERTVALRESEQELRHSRDQLEIRVQERTMELVLANRALEEEINFRRRTEQQLIVAKDAAEHANRAKSEFLANMSHEIRTPINGILGMTEITLSTDLEDDQREYLEIVKVSADSLLGIVNELLDFSAIEEKKLTLDKSDFRLGESVHELMHSLSPRASQKGLKFGYKIDPNVPDELVGDPLRLRQVLLNLLDNAIKFTDKGSVSLAITAQSSQAESTCLQFSVRDTGIGISKDKQVTVFDAFSQADTSSTRRYGGTGLGLTISSNLAKMMGGRLSVESELGQGSRFQFTASFDLPDGPAGQASELSVKQRAAA